MYNIYVLNPLETDSTLYSVVEYTCHMYHSKCITEETFLTRFSGISEASASKCPEILEEIFLGNW